MRGERRLRPVVQDALRRDRHQLARSVVDQSNNMPASFIIEPPRGKNLGNLFAKLTVALQRRLDVLADRRAQACLERRGICPGPAGMLRPCGRGVFGAREAWQRLLDGARDGSADAALQIFIRGLLECRVCREMWLATRALVALSICEG